MAPSVSLKGRNIWQRLFGKRWFQYVSWRNSSRFPSHPHRGFETVTIVLEGLIDHIDSKGNEGRYGNGDVQWMTAGAGCQHNEMFPLIHTDKKNILQLFQIWLNLPARNKFAEPGYKMLWNEDIPVLRLADQKGHSTELTRISGKINEHEGLPAPADSWAAEKQNNVLIALFKWKQAPHSGYRLFRPRYRGISIFIKEKTTLILTDTN
jgi:redox-sensitive bicupin YhaK (pirin superfamily)